MERTSILQDSSRINLSPARILIVDDNPKSLKILCDLVGSFGARAITVANDGLQAQALLSQGRFDLLITDAFMPGIDGYDLVRWLRARPSDEERTMPALIVSAHTREEEIAKGRDCGANFMIAKPISPATLLEKIFWISNTEQKFLVCPGYVGPDRRRRDLGPPAGLGEGRRRGDQTGASATPADDQLSFGDLDALQQPKEALP